MNISIFDLRGRLVENLYKGSNIKGQHTIKWNASYYASGVYFINMLVNGNVYKEKIILLK